MNWVFTWNNPDYDAELPNVWPHVKYAIWQHERGEQGTPHYQGYVQFDKLMSWQQVMDCQPLLSWTEPRAKNSSHKQAKAYASKPESRWCGGEDDHVCTKGCGPWEFGTETHQGLDAKLLPLMAAVKKKATELEVVDIDPTTWARYMNALKRYRTLCTPYRDGQPVVTTVYWGDTGVGKSRRVWFEAGPDAYPLMVPQNQGERVCWDDYAGQEDVIIEEFEGQIPQKLMLSLCDRYKHRVNMKGGSMLTNIRRVWITSNDNPLTWWKNKGYEPFARRTVLQNGKVEHMISPWSPETDGELLALDVQAMTDKIIAERKAIDDQMAQLEALLPEGHPQKKRRIGNEPQVVPIEEKEQRASSSTGQRARDGPTNWYDCDGNDKLQEE